MKTNEEYERMIRTIIGESNCIGAGADIRGIIQQVKQDTVRAVEEYLKMKFDFEGFPVFGVKEKKDFSKSFMRIKLENL